MLRSSSPQIYDSRIYLLQQLLLRTIQPLLKTQLIKNTQDLIESGSLTNCENVGMSLIDIFKHLDRVVFSALRVSMRCGIQRTTAANDQVMRYLQPLVLKVNPTTHLSFVFSIPADSGRLMITKTQRTEQEHARPVQPLKPIEITQLLPLFISRKNDFPGCNHKLSLEFS